MTLFYMWWYTALPHPTANSVWQAIHQAIYYKLRKQQQQSSSKKGLKEFIKSWLQAKLGHFWTDPAWDMVLIKDFQGDVPNKRCHEPACLVTNTRGRRELPEPGAELLFCVRFCCHDDRRTHIGILFLWNSSGGAVDTTHQSVHCPHKGVAWAWLCVCLDETGH